MYLQSLVLYKQENREMMNFTENKTKRQLLYVYGIASGANKKLFKISERENQSVQIIPYLGLRDGFTESGELIKESHFSVHPKNEYPMGMIHFTKSLKNKAKGALEGTQTQNEAVKQQIRNYSTVIESPVDRFTHVISVRFSNLANDKHNFKAADKEERHLLANVDLTSYTLIASVFVGHKDSIFPTNSERADFKIILTQKFKIVICYLHTVLIPVPFNSCYASFTYPGMDTNGFNPNDCLNMFESHVNSSTYDQLYWTFEKQKTELEMKFFEFWEKGVYELYEEFIKKYVEETGTFRYFPKINYEFY